MPIVDGRTLEAAGGAERARGQAANAADPWRRLALDGRGGSAERLRPSCVNADWAFTTSSMRMGVLSRWRTRPIPSATTRGAEQMRSLSASKSSTEAWPLRCRSGIGPGRCDRAGPEGARWRSRMLSSHRSPNSRINFHRPTAFPKVTPGGTDTFKPADLVKFRGHLEHLHVSDRKVDCCGQIVAHLRRHWGLNGT